MGAQCFNLEKGRAHFAQSKIQTQASLIRQIRRRIILMVALRRRELPRRVNSNSSNI